MAKDKKSDPPDKHRYSIEIMSEGFSYFRESSITPHDNGPILAAERVVGKLLRRLSGRSLDYADVIVRVVKDRT